MGRRWIFFLVFGLVLLSVIGFLVYLNFFYLPKEGLLLVKNGLEIQTALKAELAKVSLHPFKGIVLDQLLLKDPARGENPVFETEQVSVRPIWPALLFQKRFIASSVAFEKPSFSLSRTPEGTWNIGEYWKKPETGQPPVSITLKIIAHGGSILFSDQAMQPPLSRRITHLDAEASFRPPGSLRFKGSFGIEGSSVQMTLRGRYSITEKVWAIKGMIKQFVLSDLPDELQQALHFLRKAEGNLSFEAMGDQTGKLSFREILFEGMSAFQTEAMTGESRLTLTGDLSILPDQTDPDYHFNGTLEGGTFQIPLLKKPLEETRGTVVLKNDELLFEEIESRSENTAVLIRGRLFHFGAPEIDLEASFTQPLTELEHQPFFQKIPERFRPSLEGKARWRFLAKGAISGFSEENLSGAVFLEDALFKSSLLDSPVETLNGEISFQGRKIFGKKITGMYKGIPFSLEGSLEPHPQPKLQFSFDRKEKKLASSFAMREKDLSPFELTYQTPKSIVSLKGEILNYEDPIFRVEGQWEGPLEGLSQFEFLRFPTLPETLAKTEILTRFSLLGPKNVPEQITLNGMVSTPSLRYKKLSFQDVTGEYAYTNGLLQFNRISGRFFGGEVSGEAVLELSGEKPYRFHAIVKYTRLEELMASLSPEQKGFRGLLSADFQAEGIIGNAESFTGKGWVALEEGELFRYPILKGLTPVLRPVIATIYPELDDIIAFNAAYVSLDVREKTVRTDNLILKGNQATFYGEGTCGFNQSLDFRLWVQFTDPDIIERSTKLLPLKNIFINEVGMLSGEIKLTGTLKDPKYRYVPLALDQLKTLFKETGNYLLERLFE